MNMHRSIDLSQRELFSNPTRAEDGPTGTAIIFDESMLKFNHIWAIGLEVEPFEIDGDGLGSKHINIP